MQFLAILMLSIFTPVGAQAAPGISSHSIPLEFVYRSDENRTVLFQGYRGNERREGDGLESFCGSSGQSCRCLLFRSASDRSPVQGVTAVLSPRHNSWSCNIPQGFHPGDFTFARLENKASRGARSDRMRVRSRLELSEITGGLDNAKVRGIYRYSCTRTFLEGEGVSPLQVSCPPSQRLGLIEANYQFYLYNSQMGGNLHEKGSGSVYEFPVCERQIEKFRCNSTPELRWGLYGERNGIFQVGITLTARPEGDYATSIYGFAALPDLAGNCPAGLVKIRPWVAQPESITEGSLDGLNPPSSFVNQNNSLNNTLLELAPPANFQVLRMASKTPCEAQHSDPAPRPAPGSCRNAEFRGAALAKESGYTALSPVVCAIPSEALQGLF
jgi:hypothetical protein